MDPIRKVGSRGPHEDVQSNETEGALVQIPIRADEAATHEAQIEFLAEIRPAGTGTDTRYIRDAELAVEVVDG